MYMYMYMFVYFCIQGEFTGHLLRESLCILALAACLFTKGTRRIDIYVSTFYVALLTRSILMLLKFASRDCLAQ